MRTLYLKGPIWHCTDEEVHGWRNYVKNSLSGLYDLIDPSDEDYRGKEAEHYVDIVQGDIARIARSDAVIWNRWKVSEGSSMEAPYARMFGKPVFLVCAEEDLSPWVLYHTITRFASIEAAVGWFAEQKIGPKPTPTRLRRAAALSLRIPDKP
jgi:nucleoside 2-deoxyribosyltransferase